MYTISRVNIYIYTRLCMHVCVTYVPAYAYRRRKQNGLVELCGEIEFDSEYTFTAMSDPFDEFSIKTIRRKISCFSSARKRVSYRTGEARPAVVTDARKTHGSPGCFRWDSTTGLQWTGVVRRPADSVFTEGNKTITFNRCFYTILLCASSGSELSHGLYKKNTASSGNEDFVIFTRVDRVCKRDFR